MKLVTHLTATIAVVTTVAAALMATSATAAPTTSMHGDMKMTQGDMNMSAQRSSLRAQFNFLSHQVSNRCTLQPSTVMRMPSTARLQGACCAPMVFSDYVKQLHGLKAYAQVSEIPADPYNVSVALAQRLFQFDRSYTLNAAQQTTYNAAMKMASEHGPCCCRCWRYVAFRGQAKELIARRRYSSAQIAQIWDLEDGCGSGNGGMMMG